MDESLHDAVEPGYIGFQLLHCETAVWGPWVDLVVRVWPSLWGCLGLDLDIQFCNGVFDCIIVQVAIDGDGAWPLMGESTWVLWGAIGGEVWVLWSWSNSIWALCGDGGVQSRCEGQLEGQGYSGQVFLSDGVKWLSRRIRVGQGVSGRVEGVRHGWVCKVVKVLLDGARWLGHNAVCA